MDELERRLRAAMTSAAEQPPNGLMAGIRRRHRRHIRRLGAGAAAAAAAIALAFPAATHALQSGPPPAAPRFSAPPARPVPAPVAIPGTILLTCTSGNVGQLSSNWRAGSLRAGPLWLVDGRRLGYAHYPGATDSVRAAYRQANRTLVVMIVEVANGSTAVMKPVPQARSYFQFLDGFYSGGGNPLPSGDTGYTFAACPRGTSGPNGGVTDFYLGFHIKAGRSAAVDIWPSPSARPIRVIFN
jgi:hypothetical protein